MRGCSVPTRFLKSWIDTHYLGHITAALAAEFGALARILGRGPVVARPDTSRSRQPICPCRGPRSPRALAELRGGPARRPPRPRSLRRGPPARTPWSVAARSPADVLDLPGRVLQPAGVHRGEARGRKPRRPGSAFAHCSHSAVGLGKTHLLQAVAHTAAAQGRPAIYLTAEKFMYGFVAALQAQTSIAFKERLRAIDLLISTMRSSCKARRSRPSSDTR